jgi:hypothetical protein
MNDISIAAVCTVIGAVCTILGTTIGYKTFKKHLKMIQKMK